MNQRSTTWLHPTRPGYPPFVQVDKPQMDAVSRIDGSPVDVTELYDRFGKPAFSLACRILGDAGLAEDVLQEVFLQIWRAPSAFDPARGSFSTWVMTMVHHRSVDVVRREQSQRSRRDRAEIELAMVPRSKGDVEDEVCNRAVADRVRFALDALPPAQRQALTLAYYQGFTQCEIADVTGTPLGTVKTRMRAGMVQLRRLLHEVAVTVPVRAVTAS